MYTFGSFLQSEAKKLHQNALCLPKSLHPARLSLPTYSQAALPSTSLRQNTSKWDVRTKIIYKVPLPHPCPTGTLSSCLLWHLELLRQLTLRKAFLKSNFLGPCVCFVSVLPFRHSLPSPPVFESSPKAAMLRFSAGRENLY